MGACFQRLGGLGDAELAALEGGQRVEAGDVEHALGDDLGAGVGRADADALALEVAEPDDAGVGAG